MKAWFVLLVTAPSVNAFATLTQARQPSTSIRSAERNDRRSMLFGGAVAAAASVFPQWPALAIPMVKTDEFENILRDSGRSIQIVEFAGTKGETVTVRLIDGTTFGISDLIESPTDPRSPLKISAMCRQYKVPTKFVAFDAILATTPKKKKVYMNSIVQKAAEKQVLKIERMRQDEEERLAALYQMETDEARRGMK